MTYIVLKAPLNSNQPTINLDIGIVTSDYLWCTVSMWKWNECLLCGWTQTARVEVILLDFFRLLHSSQPMLDS